MHADTAQNDDTGAISKHRTEKAHNYKTCAKPAADVTWPDGDSRTQICVPHPNILVALYSVMAGQELHGCTPAVGVVIDAAADELAPIGRQQRRWVTSDSSACGRQDWSGSAYTVRVSTPLLA